MASLMTFIGTLRISEVVASGKNDKSRLAVQWQDVKVEEGKVQIPIRQSTADQLGKGTQITLGQCSISINCPVKASRTDLKIRGQGPGYLFQHTDESPLTKYQFSKLNNLALDTVGVQGMKFGTHSFRISAASTEATLGYSSGDQASELVVVIQLPQICKSST